MPRSEVKPIVVALAGNPNSGKTTLFNQLTGARQHVGNYPGVTVEKKEGERTWQGRRIRFVDLPGTYSLTAYSTEELVARGFIIDERPDVVVDIIDSSNLERNLYLAVQLLEMGVPLVLAFNMRDEAVKRGIEINHALLSQLLGVPIVPTEGHRGVGMEALLDAVLEAAAKGASPARSDLGRLPADIEAERSALAELIRAEPALAAYREPAWLAMKLLENDEALQETTRRLARDPARILEAAAAAGQRIRSRLGEEPEILIGDHRYGIIAGACRESVRSTMEARRSLSEQIDKVLTNRVLGIPVFLAMMWLVFQATFRIGQVPMGWIEKFFEWLGRAAARGIADPTWNSLIVDGAINGVGGVVVFLPNILILFFAIAMLEDSGYMARAAFIMDRVMHWLGLHGKSFIPMLIGFGCSVPGIMATRTLESRRDRLTTMLIVPFMSCGARLPVYVLLTGAFFPRAGADVMLSIYLLGIAVAIIMAKVFRKTLLRGESSPFIMELPPYRVPTLRSVIMHMWRRAWMYLRKAGTLILGISMVIWALTRFPSSPALESEYARRIAAAPDEQRPALRAELREKRLAHSIAGRMGRTVAVALRPVGLGHWKIGTALIAGFGAKEVVVATLGTLYSAEEAADEHAPGLRARLRADPFLTPLAAYSLMVFVLLYVPCAPTIAVVRHETRSWLWPLFLAGYTTAVAWIMAALVYQGGRLLGLG